jgi:DNA-binding transcriptional MerR regulator
MRIGELAQQTCVSKSIIRYYETIGLIPHPRREPSGYRSYTEADVDRIRLVVRARLAGLNVPDIRELLQMQYDGQPPSQHLLAVLERKTDEVRLRVEHLQGLEAQLQGLYSLGLKLAEIRLPRKVAAARG